MTRLSFLSAAFAALLCVHGAAATCCNGEPMKCPANETSSYAGTITYTSVCCADGQWDCQRNGKGTAGDVCSSRGGRDQACPAPKCCDGVVKECPPNEQTPYGNVTYVSVCCASGNWECQRRGKGTVGSVCTPSGGLSKACPKPNPKCCNGDAKQCPPDEDTKYGKVTYTPVCCANGNWECQRNGKGTAGSVCASFGGTTDPCPKPTPKPQCCNGEPKECPADEETKYGKVTYTSVCCADGAWECQRNGKGTAGHVCTPRGGKSTACPTCCRAGPKKCPESEETKYGTVTYDPVCCANGKMECQRNGKGTAGSVCAPAGGVSQRCSKCCKGKQILCPPNEDTKYGKVTYTPVCCGDGMWYCQRDGKGTAGHVCTGKRGITRQCPPGTGSRYGYWVSA